MTIKTDLNLFQPASGPNPYEQYGLLDNPFPKYGDQPRADVCTDQSDVKSRLVSMLGNFETGAKRLWIHGESGAGKTHILRYFQHLIDAARGARKIGNIYPVYVYAPGDSYFVVHDQIVDALSELFLERLLAILREAPGQVDQLVEQVKPAAEVLAALRPLTKQRFPFAPYEEREVDTFIRWFKGGKVTARDRRFLGDVPVPDISSTSLAIRFAHGFLGVLKQVRLCDGIVLLFDEFEEIFEGLTRAGHSRYAQDLRHMLDTLQEQMLFVIATVPEPGDLAQYPAIQRRLGQSVPLQPIDSEELAIEYARDYLLAGRRHCAQVFGVEGDQDSQEGLHPLTADGIAEEYRALAHEARSAGLEVLPGYFLPRMRELLQRVVETHSGD